MQKFHLSTVHETTQEHLNTSSVQRNTPVQRMEAQHTPERSRDIAPETSLLLQMTPVPGHVIVTQRTYMQIQRS